MRAHSMLAAQLGLPTRATVSPTPVATRATVAPLLAARVRGQPIGRAKLLRVQAGAKFQVPTARVNAKGAPRPRSNARACI